MNILLQSLFYLIFFSGQIVKTDLNNPDIKIVLLSKETNEYQVSIYNNSDSVLCILTSVFGKYKKDECDTLLIGRNQNYDISYSLFDSQFDSYVPIKDKLCILSHQELNFIVRLEKLRPNSFLQVHYYYSNDYCLDKAKKERKNPLWYKKYNWKLRDTKIPF